MTARRIFNKYHNDAPTGSVYIGRGSPWGNPFAIGDDGDRDEVIRKFDEHIHSNDDLLSRVKKELAGKNLVCFCYPKPCHGDILSRIANGDS